MKLHAHVLTILTLALAVLVGAEELDSRKVSEQFALNTMKDVSSCFSSCHEMVTSTIRLPNRDINFPQSITLNCEYSAWITLISACMTTRCTSAPDYVYALEYGTRYCKRAGVAVKFDIPQWFLESPGGAYYNATISAAREFAIPVGPTIVVAVASVALALL